MRNFILADILCALSCVEWISTQKLLDSLTEQGLPSSHILRSLRFALAHGWVELIRPEAKRVGPRVSYWRVTCIGVRLRRNWREFVENVDGKSQCLVGGPRYQRRTIVA